MSKGNPAPRRPASGPTACDATGQGGHYFVNLGSAADGAVRRGSGNCGAATDRLAAPRAMSPS